MFGDLEKAYSVISSKNVSAIWRDPSAITLEVWRNLFGKIMVGDLEKSFRRFWRKPFGDFVLELVMEYRSARRPYVEIKK